MVDDKNQGLGVHFVRVSDPDDRKKLLEVLEKAGYKLNEDSSLTKQEVLESNLPIRVDIENKVYNRVGNITCAAAATTQGVIETVSEFYTFFNK